jgi:alanine racemase
MYRKTFIQVDGEILENNVKNIIDNYSEYKYYFGVVKNNAYHSEMHTEIFINEIK